MENYTKENYYTLTVVTPFPGTKGTLIRQFNYASEQLLTVFRERDSEKGEESGVNGSISIAIAIALTSSMQIQLFSELTSHEEIKMMREKLIELKGHPPEIKSKPRSIHVGSLNQNPSIQKSK